MMWTGAPKNTLKMSEVESLYDICSTHYFRVPKNIFRSNIIKCIENFGHEIGYHYEVMDKARGDMELTRHVFKSELAKLRSLSVSQHK
jgi:hypothetical protein